MSSLISKYKILKDNNLVIQHHEGVLNLSNYIIFAEQLYTDPNYSSNFNHLICIRKVTINASLDDIIKYVKFSKKNFKTPTKRCISVVTNTPSQVVASTLFKLLQKNITQEVEIFSTSESALEWLNLEHPLTNDFLEF